MSKASGTDAPQANAPAATSTPAEKPAAPDGPQAQQDRLVELIAEDLGGDRLELPGFPEAVLRVQRTIQSPNSGAEDVVRVLSSEPALAAQALRIANSVQFLRAGSAVTDLRAAVSRLGFNLVRSIAVAHAIQQLRLREAYSAAAKRELEAIWRRSIEVAAASYVIAKHCTRVNPDQALLAGLLHVLGRLYLVMRTEGIGGAWDAELLQSAAARQGEIGRMILASWGLPEPLQQAVEHQDDLDHAGEALTVTHVLIAAKRLTTPERDDSAPCPVIDRIAAENKGHPAEVLEKHADELHELTRSFMH